MNIIFVIIFVVRPLCLVGSKHIKDTAWKCALYFTSLTFCKHQGSCTLRLKKRIHLLSIPLCFTHFWTDHRTLSLLFRSLVAWWMAWITHFSSLFRSWLELLLPGIWVANKQASLVRCSLLRSPLYFVFDRNFFLKKLWLSSLVIFTPHKSQLVNIL